MKGKSLRHPRLYLNIVEKTNDSVLVEYKSNKFDENGNRIIKVISIKLQKEYQNCPENNEILNKLNKKELNRITNYIKIQSKVLEHHKKNNNINSFNTVLDSIKIMKNFKKEIEISEF